MDILRLLGHPKLGKNIIPSSKGPNPGTLKGVNVYSVNQTPTTIYGFTQSQHPSSRQSKNPKIGKTREFFKILGPPYQHHKLLDQKGPPPDTPARICGPSTKQAQNPTGAIQPEPYPVSYFKTTLRQTMMVNGKGKGTLGNRKKHPPPNPPGHSKKLTHGEERDPLLHTAMDHSPTYLKIHLAADNLFTWVRLDLHSTCPKSGILTSSFPRGNQMKTAQEWLSRAGQAERKAKKGSRQAGHQTKLQASSKPQKQQKLDRQRRIKPPFNQTIKPIAGNNPMIFREDSSKSNHIKLGWVKATPQKRTTNRRPNWQRKQQQKEPLDIPLPRKEPTSKNIYKQLDGQKMAERVKRRRNRKIYLTHPPHKVKTTQADGKGGVCFCTGHGPSLHTFTIPPPRQQHCGCGEEEAIAFNYATKLPLTTNTLHRPSQT
ncbi:hypothetical protein HNY73_007373 [Argiope bruennichi]|uniref:Uncharacterized protein n=1 Tax=Argiope bruennichi TaxID=94029 RepID=A0A8T0FGA9_ARGBR|nr:hypothetical protein HNY73_007373 [Argiope bruennichi]